MPKIAQSIFALLCVGLLILCGGLPQIGADHPVPATLFAGITAAAEADLITVTIKRFLEISGLSNTTVYGLMNRGEIETVQIGRRRLIILASYHTSLISC
jgi:hypothetical protein